MGHMLSVQTVSRLCSFVSPSLSLSETSTTTTTQPTTPVTYTYTTVFKMFKLKVPTPSNEKKTLEKKTLEKKTLTDLAIPPTPTPTTKNETPTVKLCRELVQHHKHDDIQTALFKHRIQINDVCEVLSTIIKDHEKSIYASVQNLHEILKKNSTEQKLMATASRKVKSLFHFYLRDVKWSLVEFDLLEKIVQSSKDQKNSLQLIKLFTLLGSSLRRGKHLIETHLSVPIRTAILQLQQTQSQTTDFSVLHTDVDRPEYQQQQSHHQSQQYQQQFQQYRKQQQQQQQHISMINQLFTNPTTIIMMDDEMIRLQIECFHRGEIICEQLNETIDEILKKRFKLNGFGF